MGVQVFEFRALGSHSKERFRGSLPLRSFVHVLGPCCDSDQFGYRGFVLLSTGFQGGVKIVIEVELGTMHDVLHTSVSSDSIGWTGQLLRIGGNFQGFFRLRGQFAQDGLARGLLEKVEAQNTQRQAKRDISRVSERVGFDFEQREQMPDGNMDEVKREAGFAKDDQPGMTEELSDPGP